jgi:hypothetical protein
MLLSMETLGPLSHDCAPLRGLTIQGPPTTVLGYFWEAWLGQECTNVDGGSGYDRISRLLPQDFVAHDRRNSPTRGRYSAEV